MDELSDLNNRNDTSAGVTPSLAQNQTQCTSGGPAADLPTIAAIGMQNSPPWAGDIIASIPEGAGGASAEGKASAAPTNAPVTPSQSGSGEDTTPRQPVALSECPLHTAMRRLAEAAVAQHVLYLEGEVRPRPGLISTVSRWERMHTIIRECICPATREVAVGAPAVGEIVDSTLDQLFTPGQQHLRAQFVHALEVCAACTSTAECPLGAPSNTE